MNYPSLYYVGQHLRYCYSEDQQRTHEDKLRGLIRHGPLRKAPNTHPHCLFVFLDSSRDDANKLYLYLRNGIEKFPGCSRLTGVSVEKDTVASVRVPPPPQSEDSARRFKDSLEDYLAKFKRPDFAFVIFSRQRSGASDPYDTVKAVLTRFGIPSQWVSLELLDSPSQIRYAMSNIALSFFVKLGGQPWSVSAGRPKPALIVGVGSALARYYDGSRPAQRFIGYALCVLSNGVYLDMSFFPPADSYEQFLDQLSQGLQSAVRQTLATHSSIERVTMHVSSAERRETAKTIENAIDQYRRDQEAPIPFEVIRLTSDSDFAVYDMSDPGYVSTEGTVVALAENRALLVTEGRKQKAVWRGRKPVTLEIQRQHASSHVLPLKDAVEDLFALAMVNWRGFNAVTQPISLQYAKLLTEQVLKMSRVDPDICKYIAANQQLRSVPWFI